MGGSKEYQPYSKANTGKLADERVARSRNAHLMDIVRFVAHRSLGSIAPGQLLVPKTLTRHRLARGLILAVGLKERLMANLGKSLAPWSIGQKGASRPFTICYLGHFIANRSKAHCLRLSRSPWHS